MKIIDYKICYPSVFEEVTISEKNNWKFKKGEIDLTQLDISKINRSDLKVMRSDVKASVILVQELLDKVGLTAEEREKTGLLVANGAFVESSEKHLSKIPETYKELDKKLTDPEKLNKIYRMSPPLLALETLTNSTMSYIAQYGGIKGHNVTYGTTSISAYFVLKEAYHLLEEGRYQNILVCTSNCAGDYAFLCDAGTSGYTDGWFQSSGSCCLLLTKGNTTRKTLGSISCFDHAKSTPDILEERLQPSFQNFIDDNVDKVHVSGSFNNESYRQDLSTINTANWSPFEKFGHLGVCNITFSIIEALNQTTNRVQVLDIDQFGRESSLIVTNE